jgi:urea-proton symporter
LASYIHTAVIFAVLITMVFLVYVKFYSSDQIYDLLDNTVTKTEEQCEAIYSDGMGNTFYEKGKYACGPIAGNKNGSYLTMVSSDGLMFGAINIVGNFGTVFVDQSYWQSAIAAKPECAAKGYLLGGYVCCRWVDPYSLNHSCSLISHWVTLFVVQTLLVRYSFLFSDLSRTCFHCSDASYHCC